MFSTISPTKSSSILMKFATRSLQKRMQRLAGANQKVLPCGDVLSLAISDVPINLKIFSPNVLTLTLVDLPGLTKVCIM